MKTRSQLCALVASLLCIASLAHSQCGILLDDEAPPSDRAWHYSLSEWDFDGPGPLPIELLLGTDRGRVMAFDGTRWRQVGPLISSPYSSSTYYGSTIFDMVNYQDSLHVITAHIRTGSRAALMRFNGSSWDAIPMLQNGCVDYTGVGHIQSSTVWNDKIVVVGRGIRCISQSALALTWDGTSWAPLGDAAPTDYLSEFVYSVLATSDGRLLIGGRIPLQDGIAIVAELVDGVWVTRVSSGSQTSASTRILQEIDGTVYALTSAAIVPGLGDVPIGVLREDPQSRVWTAWHTATDADSAADSGVQLAKVGNTWYLAANRGEIGFVLSREGDNGPWSRTDPVGGFQFPLRGLKVFDQSLIAMGATQYEEPCDQFSTIYHAPVTQPIRFKPFPSRFVGYEAPNLSLGGILATGDGLFTWVTPDAGAHIFTSTSSETNPQCNSSIAFAAHLSNDDWSVGRGLRGYPFRTLLEYEGQTLAFGQVNGEGNPSSYGVARWNDGVWRTFPANNTYSSRIPDSVHSAVVHQGQLLASVGLPASKVTQWNGESWVNYSTTLPFPSPLLVSVGETLYAYVRNTTSIARFGGISWALLPTPPGIIRSANNINGELYLNLVESSTTPVVKLENDMWLPVGTFPAAAKVRSLAWHQGELFAGMEYLLNESALAPLMVYRDGVWIKAISTTFPFTPPNHLPATINTMHSDGQTLHLAGNFSFIGGLWAESWIRFYSGPPRLVSEPQSTQVLPGDTAYFSVRPQVYHDPNQTYEWRLNNTPLADGPTGTGSIISGATTPYLRITNISAENQGEYNLIITNNCGSTTSANASLTLGTPYCPADFNQDGGIDLSDVEAFFIAWDNGLDQADVDQSGGVDGADIQAFFPLWEAGGC